MDRGLFFIHKDKIIYKTSMITYRKLTQVKLVKVTNRKLVKVTLGYTARLSAKSDCEIFHKLGGINKMSIVKINRPANIDRRI